MNAIFAGYYFGTRPNHVHDRSTILVDIMRILYVVLFFRYFTGHTKDNNGGPQFVKGKTKVGHVIDDVVKVLTVAVCFLVNNLSLIGIRDPAVSIFNLL